MITKRQRTIITILIEKNDWITSSQLANLLSISVRTLKSEIQFINQNQSNCIISSKKGYYIQRDKVSSLLQEVSQIPENYEERKYYILKEMILNDSISFDQLCEKLCISNITLQNELNRIRSEISQHQLNIHIKKNQIFMSGSDRGKRHILLDMINKELENSFFSITSIQKLFPHTDLSMIKNIVSEILTQYQYFLDDYSLTNYVMHIAMMMELNHYSDKEDEKMIYSKEAEEIITDIYRSLKNYFITSNFTLKDIFDASILMMTRITPKKDANINEFIDDDILRIIEIISKEVYKNYSIHLDFSHFLTPFSFHLKNLFIRLKTGIHVTNIQFRQIKQEYPLIYSISVFIAQIIEKQIHIALPEDEIAFIALHIGTIIEEQHILNNKVKCLVFAPDYYSFGERISQQLSQHFQDILFISDVVTSLDECIDWQDFDLIITTASVHQVLPLPYLKIKPFLTHEDIHRCYLYIEDIKQQKQKQTIIKKLDYFFHENCFYVNKGFQNKDEIIETVCDQLYKLDYVDEQYKQKIYERENISSSAYGNMAIPHPLNNDAKKSVIAVIIEKKGVYWEPYKVNIVFMLSLKKEDHEYFAEIFNFITSLIQNESILEKLTHIQSFQEFVKIIVEKS